VIRIHPATREDAVACARIYAPYVTDSAISFELEPPDADEMARRIEAAHVWLVAEDRGEVVGYAYGGTHRPRAAYRFTVEVTVYVDAAHQRRGLGRRLYAELFDVLRERGFRLATAGVTLPNDASDGLHRAMGFEEVGVYRNVGFKDGVWYDVRWYQLDLRPDAGTAP
jgi:L-amino acid N-acyltransferase YncA